MCSPHLKDRKQCFLTWGQNNHIKYLEFFSRIDLSFSLCSFTQSFITSVDSWVFILYCVLIQYYFIFLPKSSHLSPLGTLLVDSCVPVTYFLNYREYLSDFQHFLSTLQDTQGSYFFPSPIISILPSSFVVLLSAFLCRSLDPLIGECTINQTRNTSSSSAQRPGIVTLSDDRARTYVCVCIQPCVCTYLHLFLCVSICIDINLTGAHTDVSNSNPSLHKSSQLLALDFRNLSLKQREDWLSPLPIIICF